MKQIIRQIYFVIFGIMLFSSVVISQTLTVPTDYPTIEDALAAAQPGYVVQIDAGSYNLTSNLYVRDDVTLKLQDGVTVFLNGFTHLPVNGKLETNGKVVILNFTDSYISKTLTVPTDYPTIEAAFAVAQPGYVVQVDAGSYTGNNNWALPLEVPTGVTLRLKDGVTLDIVNGFIVKGNLEINGKVVISFPESQRLAQLFGSFMRDNYVEALKTVKLIISTYKNSASGYDQNAYSLALCNFMPWLIQVARSDKNSGLGDFKELLEYLKAYTKDDENAPVSIKLAYPNSLYRLDCNEEAILEYEEILKIESITTNEKLQILNHIHHIYLNYIKDSEKAKEVELRIKLINDGIVIDRYLDFGYVTVGEQKQGNLRITNNGTAPFVISQVSISGAGVTLLNNKTPETPMIIQPGESKDITIEFSPIAEIRYEANVGIRFGGTEYIIHNISVSGFANSNYWVVSVDKPAELPTDYSISQNYPNPFNPTTTIQFAIPKDEYVKLVVYDITGKVVKELVNGYKSAGKYNVEFNASGYASGMYYYKIEAGAYKSVQKMMLMK